MGMCSYNGRWATSIPVTVGTLHNKLEGVAKVGDINNIEWANTEHHTSLLEIFNKPGARIVGMSATLEAAGSLLRAAIGGDWVK